MFKEIANLLSIRRKKMKNNRTAVKYTNLLVVAAVISLVMALNLAMPGKARASFTLGDTDTTSTSAGSGQQSRIYLVTTPNLVNMEVIGANMRGSATGNFRVAIYDGTTLGSSNLLTDLGAMSYSGPTGSFMTTPAPATQPYYQLPTNTAIGVAWKNDTSGTAMCYYLSSAPSGLSASDRGFDTSGTSTAYTTPLPSGTSGGYYYNYCLVYDLFPTIASMSSTSLTNGQTGVTITGAGFETYNQFATAQSTVYLATGSTWAAKGTTVDQTPSSGNWGANPDTSSTSDTVTFTVNQGSLPSGTLYVYVQNSDGEVNANGYAVTLGGTPTTVGTLSATAETDTSISVSSAWSGGTPQSCTLQYRTTSPQGAWQTFATPTITPGNPCTGTATGLNPGIAYDFQAVYTNSAGFTGSSTASLPSVSTTDNNTYTGALTPTSVSDTAISVQAAYTGDVDNNNGCTISYSTSLNGTYTALTTTKGTGVYTASVSGLTAGTTYYFHATFTETSPDIVSGTNPETLTQATTNNNTYTSALTATSVTTTSIAVQAAYTGDADNNNGCTISYSTSLNGTYTPLTTTKGTGVYTASVSGLTAGTTYYFHATFTETAPDTVVGTNPETLTQATNSANGTSPGSLSAPTIGDTWFGIDTTYSGDANNNNTCTITSSGGTVVHPAAVNRTLQSYTTTITGLQHNTSYTVFAHYTDIDGVTQPSTLSQTFTTSFNGTQPGSISISAITTNSFTVTVSYSGDNDTNNTCNITVPGGTITQTGHVTTGSKSYTYSVTGLQPNTNYTVNASFTDSAIYGSQPSPATATTPGPTKMGTAWAVVNSSTQITVFSNFSGDAPDSSTAIAYGTSPTSFPNTAPGSPVGGSSPRSSIVTGLTPGVSYYFQITDTNSTYGVTTDTGITNPLVIGPYIANTVCQSEITSCTDCHSLPPNAGSHMIAEHEGNGTRSACAVCHFNYKTMTNVTSPRWTVGHFDNTMHIYTSNHINGGIKGGYYMGLRNRSSLWAGGVENANNECTATYCHGQSNSPMWGTTGITCTACHDAPPTAGSHGMHNQGHIGYADNSNGSTNYDFGCFKCHPQSTHAQGPATSSSAAFVGPFSSISSPVTLGGTYANGTSSQNDTRGFMWSDATCTNLYCHSNGQTGTSAVYATPKWGNNTITCTSCHGQASTFATMTATTGNHLSSSHAMHAATDKYAFNCSQCHNETVSSSNSIINTALHVNGVKDVHITSPSAAYTNMTGPFNSSTNSCSNVYCHSNGNGGPPNVVPQWGVTVTNCASCHNYKAPAAAMSTGQHTYHINTPNIGKLKCYQCHAETVYTNDSTILYSNGKHINGVKDVHFYGFNGISGVYNSTTKTCSSVYCHSSGQTKSTDTHGATPTFRVISSWTKTGITYTCKSCHGGSTGGFVSQFGEPNYADYSSATMAWFNGHGEPGHVSFASDCSKCHYGTASIHTVNGFATITGTNHLNGTIDVNFRSDITGTWNATSKTCTNVSCHGPNSGTLRWGGHGNCQQCHGVNTNTEVDDFTFGNHTTATISLLQYTSVGHGKTGTYRYSGNVGANLQCTSCHTESTAHNTAGNPFRLISTNVRAGVYPSQVDTVCLYCHSTGIEVHNFHNTSTSAYANPKWLFTPKCVDCHDPHGDMGPNGRYNAYMMQSYVNYTAGSDNYGRPASAYTPYRKALNFPADAVAKTYLTMTSFATPTFTGLCQICHTRGAVDTDGLTYPAHYNRALYAPTATSGTNVPDSMTGVCTQCHAHSKGFSGAGGDCTGCHKAGGLATHTSPDNRRDIMTEFENSSSHHVVGTPVKTDCAACHAEGNYADGSLSSYHTGQAGHPVYLKQWITAIVPGSNGTQGTNFNVISTAVPTGSAAVFNTSKITPFCLGCHNDTNKNATPFSDGLTPTAYSWDYNSIASKYNNISTTPWGKFNSTLYNVVPADAVTKAYSPHGNPGKNESVMSIASFSTYSSTKAVACLDCHNAHASNVSGGTSYKSKNPEGGILNSYSSAAGKLRWRPTRFTPTAGGSSATKNMYSASSDLCFSCHNGDNPAIAKNYSSFGLKRGMTVAGSYYDRVGNTKVWTNWSTTRWSTNDVWRGSFAYKDANFAGGHFGNSLNYLQEGMSNLGSYEKNLGRALVNSSGYGNCTACHDPHGVSTDWTTGSYSRPVRTLAMSNATSIPTASGSYSGTNTGIFVVQVTSTGANPTYQLSGDGGKTWMTGGTAGGTGLTVSGVLVTLPAGTYTQDDTWTFLVGYSTITKQYMIPALKGTWMHSPYKEDRAPRNTYTTDTANGGTARLSGITNANDFSTYNPSSMPGRLWDDLTGGTSTSTTSRNVGGPAPRANPDFKAGSYDPGYNAVAIQGDGFGRGPNMGTSYLYGTGYKNISSLKGWNGYFIDENTFGTNVLKGQWESTSGAYTNISAISMADVNHNATPGNFAGLCLQCHAWTRSTAGAIALSNVTSSTLGTGNQHITTKPHETVSDMGTITVDLFRREVDYNGGSWSAATAQRQQGDFHNVAELARSQSSSQSADYSVGPAGVVSNEAQTNFAGATDTTAETNNYPLAHYYRWGVNPYGTGLQGSPGQGDVGFIQPKYHQFPCAKCHTPHVARLPRLMKTNCLDNEGVGKTPHTTQAYATKSSPTLNTAADGMGALFRNMACHSTKIQSWDGYNNTWESGGGWNNKTPW